MSRLLYTSDDYCCMCEVEVQVAVKVMVMVNGEETINIDKNKCLPLRAIFKFDMKTKLDKKELPYS